MSRHWLLFGRLCLLSLFALTKQQQQAKDTSDTPRPLVFEFEKEEPLRVKISWDPTVDVKKIKEISGRDVHYVINNATGKVREEYSPWLTLVTEQDDIDPTRRLLFLKSDMCVEQDYRVSWYDSNANAHENVTQRLEPSPEPWKPSAKIEITNLRYDGTTKRIVGNLAWTMSDEKLRGIPKLGSLHPSVRLESCRSLFEKPVPLPVVDPATKVVSFDPLYAKHDCTFTARLRQMTYNGELECRSLRQTTDDQSDKVELSCAQGNLHYPDCKDSDADQPCPMTCDQQVTATGEHDWSRGWPKPFVKVEWKPRGASTKSATGHLVRHAQVDSAYNNYPIEEFNVSFAELNASSNSFRLEPFSQDSQSFYTFQVCTLYEACFATAKWSSVPKHPIYATTITDKLPAPPSTTARPTTSPPILTSTGNSSSLNATSENGTRRPPRSPVDHLVEIKTETPKIPVETTRKPSSAKVHRLDMMLVFITFLSVCIGLF